MSEEIKVVICLKGNKGSIGIQAPDCDPVLTIHEGDLQSLLEMVPAMVEEARRRWAESPRYPKCEHPLPSQVLPQAQRPAQAPRQPVTQQPRMI